MKHTIRFIILIFAFVIAGAGHAWAISESDIIFNVQPNKNAGTVSNVTVSGMTVTFTATPASGYSIDASHIIAEKMVDAMAPRRAPGMASQLTITDNGSNSYSFTIPTGYTGAYVTVNFYQDVPADFTQITSLSEITNLSGKYQLTADVSGVSSSLGEFTGTLDGGLHKIIGSSAPLFASTDDAIIRNLIFEDVNITSGDSDGDAGAVTSKAKGATRIYNCGINPSSVERDNDGNITGFSGSSVGGSGNVGGLVGKLSDNARVINCYSYANITGGSIVAGIVGNIGYEEDESITQSTINTKGMVVNCMFYGDITGGSSKYPVYGGETGAMIKNDIVDGEGKAVGVNPYCYYRKNAKFDDSYGDIANYKRSWPAEEKNLTRFEYYRSILNSNRHLCTYWATNKAYASQTAADTALIAKWVLDPTIAPYPILKKWGKYSSVINKDPVYRYNPSTGTNELRSSAKEWEGKHLRAITVYVDAGGYHAGTGSASKTLTDVPVLDMDTLNCDYAYAKIQLPYYNEVFGDPSVVIPAPSDDEYISKWNQRYGGNYKEYVVTGWDITGGSAATDYNFADRNSYSGRVYAQGGYFYVPEGVESITITAHWGKAVYLANRGCSLDRVYITSATSYKGDKSFSSAGSVSKKFGTTDNIFKPAGDACTIYGDLQNAIKALGTNSDYPTVYDQAIVLVGNHQVKNGSNKVDYSLDNKWHPFTIMSADFDIDNEPDFSLQLQFRSGIDRPGIQPIRFDFLPVVELGLAVRHDNMAYAIGIMVPQGHFEVTETAFMRTTQFEYDANVSRIESKSPVILNGGEFEMFTKRKQVGDATQRDRTSYFLLGGNVWVHRFAPGAHPNSGDKPDIYLFPVNVIGGEVKELYLTGLYRPELPTGGSVIGGAPRCYVDGGKFDIMAGAGYDKVKSGEEVIFKINHSKIVEFYGGGINGSNPISGNIDVTINNSMVGKYCGGPKVGNMTGYTVTTHATGTTFGVFYGGGNGGNSYYRQLQDDGDWDSPTTTTEIGATFWNNRSYNWDGFKPLKVKDDGANNKGYHAEYEFEVFNQSNGVTDQITQRGFIKWIQFGITTTGDVENELDDCTVLNNFYGGGNLASVSGNVTSTLTNTKVNGSVFGAGYSAAIPTFQVHDKESKVFPSLDKAGTVVDGYIPYAPTVYQWTNDKLEDKNEAYMKANPTYSKEVNGETKWYCYTWNSLANLGTVTGDVTLTIDGHTTLTDDKVMSVGMSVYGGGEESGVDGSTEVNVTGGTIGAEGQGGVEYGNVYGGGKGKRDNIAAGQVKGSTKVAISNGTIYHNVYGGGAYGSVGDFEYDGTSGLPTGLKTGAAENSGKTEVYITGGTFGWNGKENGMVFGSSRGDVGAPGSLEDKMAWVYDTHVAIGDTVATTTTTAAPVIRGSVYGGGENGHNLRNAYVRINGGTIGIPTGDNVVVGSTTYEPYNYPYRGNVYGGGCGTDKYYSDPTGIENPYDGNGDKYNSLAGIVKGNALVNITAGHVVHNVYGAGAMGSVGNGGSGGKTTVNISGGRVGYDGSRNGNVFGAARGEYGTSTAASGLANVKETAVNISYTTTPTGDNTEKTAQLITGSVFGGGESGTVKESVAVTMTGGMVLKDVYGGGALADTQTSNWDATANDNAGGWAAGKTSASATTTVRLTGGTIQGEAYGGGLGETGATKSEDKPAYVYGDVLLDLNGTTTSGDTGTPVAADSRGCAVHEVFGCNNSNGTPMGKVVVHVYATQNKAKTQIGNTSGETPVTDAKVKGSYDVIAVYGGGNLAAYEPAGGKNTTNSTKVIIDGCGTTSIQQVYGGGNAASTPATEVTVNGTYEIEEVFGGGNGKDDIVINNETKPNPGANVGFYAYEDNVPGKTDTKENRATYYGYGTGAANVNIFGGTIHRVFGGSNTKGNVRHTAVTMLEDQSLCDFCVDEAYGGGKSAPMDAEAKLLMACIPGLKNAYGGAQEADILGNVTLNITNGTFDRVFGGNNISGKIRGSITVNVEESGCKPVIIGALYGGGNQAPYSVYGYNGDDPIESGTTPLYDDPKVNVKSFTSIGDIYGGGYGTTAVMVGNPTVNVNVAYGRYYNDNVSVVGENEETPNHYPIPSHDKGKMGAINNVFGGGNAAKVIGNTTVNIATVDDVYVIKEVATGNSVSGYYTRSGEGTTASPYVYTAASGNALEDTTYYEKKKVEGADIRGNVYGGGNNAEVTGNANVNIGKKNE